MTQRKPPKAADERRTAPHAIWLYKGAEARLFDEGEALPPGWLDHPKG